MKRLDAVRRAGHCGLVVLSLAAVTAPAAVAEARDFVLATGSSGGINLAIGTILSRVVAPPGEGLFVAESSEGSIASLRALFDGRADAAIVQGDVLARASQGKDLEFLTSRNRLRTIAALYPEQLIILARPDSGIASFEDLKYRRVIVGPRGSDMRATFQDIVLAAGWTPGDFAELGLLPQDRLVEALCLGEFDAAVHVAGVPDPLTSDAIAACGAVPVPVGPDMMANLIDARPYLSSYPIPADTYRGLNADVPSIGFWAQLVVVDTAEPGLAASVAEGILTGFDRLQRSDPAMGRVRKEDVASNATGAPIADEALEIFARAGLLE